MIAASLPYRSMAIFFWSRPLACAPVHAVRMPTHAARQLREQQQYRFFVPQASLHFTTRRPSSQEAARETTDDRNIPELWMLRRPRRDFPGI
ncbi:MAG: hypothetical protein HY899_00800 [Deltaproteobacteria bacterium]|nr:hypothetical protein [Deltaproteobacteria bacterium]